MKNYFKGLLSLALILCIPSLHAMDKQERDYSACDQIKKLLPAYSPEEGRLAEINERAAEDLIDLFQEQGITVCDCIGFLSTQKKEKALREVPWLTEEERAKFAGIPQPAENPGEVTCDSTIDPELCDLVRQTYQHEKPLVVSSTTDEYTLAYAPGGRGEEQIKIFINQEVGQIRKITKPLWKAILMHEVTHLNREHYNTLCPTYLPVVGIQKSLIDRVGSEIVCWLMRLPYRLNLSKTDPVQQKVASFNNWQISKEAEADRIPAACHCLNTAQNFEELTRTFFRESSQYDMLHSQGKKRVCQMFGLKSVPATSIELDKATDPVHPITSKRYQWAVTIRRLREIEEQRRLQQQQSAATQQVLRLAATRTASAQTASRTEPQQSSELQQQQQNQQQAAFRTELMKCV